MVGRHYTASLLLTLLCLYGFPAEAQSSVQAGLASNPATWGGVLPSSDVTINHAVTWDLPSATIDSLTIAAGQTLTFSRSVSTVLRVTGNVVVYGTWDRGTPDDPIPSTVTQDLIWPLTQAQAQAFVGGATFQATDIGRWCLAGSICTDHGAPHLRMWGRLVGDLAAGAVDLKVEGDARDWPVGGRVVASAARCARIRA